jgi:hypothetical protein
MLLSMGLWAEIHRPGRRSVAANSPTGCSANDSPATSRRHGDRQRMCSPDNLATEVTEDGGPRSRGSKIKGYGTSVPLTLCLHIGFGGTRAFSRVPQQRQGDLSVGILPCRVCSESPQ